MTVVFRTGSAKRSALGLLLLLPALAACGSDGAPGASCTVVANADMTSTITCGSSTVVIPRGTDGTSCTVTEDTAAGTKTIMCDDGTMVTISDGDVATCTVVDDPVANTATITCSDGTTATVASGEAGGSCSVANGTVAGTRVITCADGTSVTVTNGTSADNFRVAQFHGEEHLLSSGDYADGAKTLVTATITSATADAAGLVTVEFGVVDRAATPAPVTNLAAITAIVAKLEPETVAAPRTHWVPYIWRTETVAGPAGRFPNPPGTTALQGNNESSGTAAGNGTLTNHGDGTYTYVFATNLTSAMMGTTPITYDRGKTHRIVIMMGGHAGPTDDATFDFVPDGSALSVTRDIVETSTCQQCHGENEFHAHGGNRVSIETCAVCHTSGTTDAQGGQSLDLPTMIHRIHAGGEMGSMPGADGILWDDPATTVDESLDNGKYTIWGYRDAPQTWWKVGFPAVLDNCTSCHQGTGANVDNWKTRPSTAACASCHDDVNLVTGLNHVPGPRTEAQCSACHDAPYITRKHDFMTRDPRNIPEFTADLTFNTPPRGYYIAGESPVLTITLHDGATLIDGTTIIEDDVAEGCIGAGTSPVATPCPPRDGKFRELNLFVHGPRAHQMPVLTTNARSQVLSAGTGPWDLTGAADLKLVLDQGQLVRVTRSGGDVTFSATVTVPVVAASFAAITAATTVEMVAWLNANAAFKGRAIAYNQAGKLGIRSRNLGDVHALQLVASAVATTVFPGDLSVHMPIGYTTANDVRSRATPANNDPKAVRLAAGVTYTLDPVDDLEPGTYVANVELTDRGKIDANNYQTPTVARVTFQVGTATAELPPAGSCGSCHQSTPGRGAVLDFAGHHKELDDTATDQCNACHDMQPQNATASTWSGGVPISRRVHAVHYGSSLTYPNATVGHADGVAGRNWDITLPRDVRGCESCHANGTTSGTWATRAARLPCAGCHDTDSATAHMNVMTSDPTPAAPFSGDEQESCQTCH